MPGTDLANSYLHIWVSRTHIRLSARARAVLCPAARESHTQGVLPTDHFPCTRSLSTIRYAPSRDRHHRPVQRCSGLLAFLQSRSFRIHAPAIAPHVEEQAVAPSMDLAFGIGRAHRAVGWKDPAGVICTRGKVHRTGAVGSGDELLGTQAQSVFTAAGQARTRLSRPDSIEGRARSCIGVAGRRVAGTVDRNE